MNSRSTLALVALGALAGLASGCAGSAKSRAGSAYEPAPAHETSSGESAGVAASGGDVAQPAPDRPGLGTEFGENVHSRVVEQPFERASGEPFAAVGVHYNDAEG